MLLRKLEQMLHELYALEVGYAVSDFLITDPELARCLDSGGRQVDEKLLIAEADGEADVALYLERELLDRLDRHDPLSKLDGTNLADFWAALEGVSHFTYYAWNAARDKAVSLFELELQAEVDKYASALMLLTQQRDGEFPAALHAMMFDRVSYMPQLEQTVRQRYEEANRHAARYCRDLDEKFLRRRQSRPEAWVSELRRFFRCGHQQKLLAATR